MDLEHHYSFMEIKQISIYNFFDKKDESENEDAISVSEHGELTKFAIADGAGGVGIFCGEWARFLVNNQPDKPFTDEFSFQNWLSNLSRDFYNEIFKSIDEKAYNVKEKFLIEGSYATLIYCWLNESTNEMYYAGCGDLGLFVFEDVKNKFEPRFIFPINNQHKLNQSPEFINWNRTINPTFSVKKIKLMDKSLILLATDSLSRMLILYIIANLDKPRVVQLMSVNLIEETLHEYFKELDYIKTNNLSLNALIEEINVAFKSDDDMYNFLVGKISLGLLEKDDFSLIKISL